MASRRVNQDRRDQAFERAKAPEVIDVGGPVDEDRLTVTTEGGRLSTFLATVTAFLERAKGLEAEATDLQTQAQAMTAPTTLEQDSALQRFIQRSNGVKKSIVAHWEITSVFFQFYKRLVALRERGAGKADKAATIAQQFHNEYTRAEERRVAEENARLEREAQENAELERAQEAAKLEAEAVKREELSEALSDRERVYIAQMLLGRTGQQAAQIAGYKDPIATAGRLNSSAKIRAAIKAEQEAQALKRQATAVRQQPLNVSTFVPREAQVEKIGQDRTTVRGELFSHDALMTAFLGCLPADFTNKFGIPADIWTIDQGKLTDYARKNAPVVKRWPGVRVVETTKTI